MTTQAVNGQSRTPELLRVILSKHAPPPVLFRKLMFDSILMRVETEVPSTKVAVDSAHMQSQVCEG